MALQNFAAGVSMSIQDISIELGNAKTSMLDFLGAAASFSGIQSSASSDDIDPSAIEIKEFYAKTFSAGSGTYGTRNTHTIKYLTDAGAAQAWNSNQMIQAAENSSTNMSADTSFSARTITKHVDDYIDNDLTNADVVYNAATGTGVFDGTSAAVDSGGTGVRFYFDDTADDIMSINSSGVVANVRSITPSNLSLGAQSIGTDNVVVRATGNTQVTRTIRFYKDGSSIATATADGGGGSDFSGGGLDNTSQTEDYTFTGLSAATEYTFKCRGENAVANGADSSNLVVTTAAPATAWSNVPTDFNLHIPDGDPTANENVTSAEKSITLTNGSGNTTIQCQQPSAGDNATSRLQVRGGTSSGTYGSYANSITLSEASTYYFQFQLQENANDNNFGPEDRTITFTNNSVSNTDLQVNVKIINR
jgi:hypothetical protein